MANSNATGRKRTKTNAQHKRDGTYRADRHGGSEPKYKLGNKTPPKDLNAAAKTEWKRLVPELVRLGMFTVADRSVFAVYCQAHADFWQLTKELNAMSCWTHTARNGVQSAVPQVNARKTAWGMLKEAATRFGFDPSSRAGMDIGTQAAPKSGQQSPEDFLFGPTLAK